MKDYYYFLGVNLDASDEDIKRAYRKLSLKYHPDKNENDDFFSERFREVQEAYDTLIDSEKRRIYNQNFGREQKSRRSNLPPYIKTFASNKLRAKKGEEIILNWQTSNADVVKILPFGLENVYGERTFKITEFKDGKFHVVLQANNTLLNKSVVRGITISEIFENDFRKTEDDFKNVKPNRSFLQNPYRLSKNKRMFLAILFLILALFFILKISSN